MQGNPVYKFLSALLCYPEADFQEAVPEFREALAQMPELAAHREGLGKLLDYIQNNSLRHIQEEYVSTFDRNRHHALYIFEHVYGEDRDRGSAMVDLLEEYRNHGFELGDDELPDYLPVLLEFFSQIDTEDAAKLLGDAVHVINHIAVKLDGYGSPYAPVLQAAVSLSPVRPQPLTEPPVRDMDEAMETFGPDMQGVEPLLKPSVETIKFYPQGGYQGGR